MATTLRQLSVASPSVPYTPSSTTNSSSVRVCGLDSNVAPDSGSATSATSQSAAAAAAAAATVAAVAAAAISRRSSRPGSPPCTAPVDTAIASATITTSAAATASTVVEANDDDNSNNNNSNTSSGDTHSELPSHPHSTPAPPSHHPPRRPQLLRQLSHYPLSLPHHSANSAFPSQHPQPVYTPYASRPDQSSHLDGARSDEHMLRRKTPNGILPASYDGNHVAQLGRAHPTKHILYSARPLTLQTAVAPTRFGTNMGLGTATTVFPTSAGHFRPVDVPAPGSNPPPAAAPQPSFPATGLPVHGHLSSSTNSPLSLSFNHPALQQPQAQQQQQQHQAHPHNVLQHQQSQLTPVPHALLSVQGQQLSPFGQPFPAGGGPLSPYPLSASYQQAFIDSLLPLTNGGVSPAHVHPQYWGAMAPTIQNALGPAVFNLAGQLAPAWPIDRSLNPFQPAALRDTRYQADCLSAWSKQAMTQYVIQQQQQQQQHQNPAAPQLQQAHHPQHRQIQLQSPFQFGNSLNGALLTPGVQGVSYQSTPQQLQFFQNPFLSPGYTLPVQNSVQQHDNNPFFALPQVLPEQATPDLGTHSISNPQAGLPHHTVASQLQFLSLPGATATNTAESAISLRDKVFSWAHMIYLDLLKHAQISRKTLAAKDGTKASKPSLYPKPPKLPSSAPASARPPLGSTGGQPGEVGLANTVSPTTAWVNGQVAQYQQAISQGGSLSADWNGQPHTAASINTPTGDLLTSTALANSERLMALQRASALSASNLAHGTANLLANNPAATSFRDSQIQMSAKLAFESLKDFIDDSNWKWVEGILLAGCLAYGLLQFAQAAQMYQAVLQVDPEHVEAMSNLAASFLAMGRKSEAVQYWQRAIRLRPSNFDAVEHLVGLLCGSQNGREAVATITFVEDALRYADSSREGRDRTRSPSVPSSDVSDRAAFDTELGLESRFGDLAWRLPCAGQPGFGASGFSVSGSEIHRLMQLIHVKGNMLYALGDTTAAARAFESAVLIAVGRLPGGVGNSEGLVGLVKDIIKAVKIANADIVDPSADLVLLPPDRAVATARACFPPTGVLPGLRHIRPDSSAGRTATATISNALLSLAKILQDGAAAGLTKPGTPAASVLSTGGILALYYLSLSLQPSPSTANNVGILLAGVTQAIPTKLLAATNTPPIAGIAPGSGAALALQYYWYGLRLDSRHAHLYTNLGSLLKDAGQLEAAVRMYEQAVQCDGKFDIALANLANAIKDLGRVQDAIGYYWRAVRANPDFAEAVCGLANALGAVCGWIGRGGSAAARGSRDRWHVGSDGRLVDGTREGVKSSGWLGRVVGLAGRQLRAGESWGKGVINLAFQKEIEAALLVIYASDRVGLTKNVVACRSALAAWAGSRWEGSNVTILVERLCKQLVWRWYQELYVSKTHSPMGQSRYRRPRLPANIGVPSTPTVLPFHAFTCPLSARQVRLISQRQGLRVSVTTLQAPWLPDTVFQPPAPPEPALRVGYVSSDFNNHPLAHLMQSSFGMHDKGRVIAFCYATTPGDGSIHRAQIEREAPVFRDASSWSSDRLVKQIVADGIHILVNLNGYTRGARNEVFAARPAPIQMAFMGFAGTLGAEWCDYLLADEIAVPPSMRRPNRNNTTVMDLIESDTYADVTPENGRPTSSQRASNGPGGVSGGIANGVSADGVAADAPREAKKPEPGSIEDPDFDQTPDDSPQSWVYAENIIYCRDTFFCCDHRQSAPDADSNLPWESEQSRRRILRRQLFPNLPDHTLILGNFNQLYKLDPSTFRTWLRILARVPDSVLWLLRFPDAGEQHLRRTAALWAGDAVAARIVFTDVAPKQQHIARARICDLFLDTPECNAHTTAADVLWSGTPLLTYGRHPHKMCSRMAGSILRGALPKTVAGNAAAQELMASSDEDYEEKAVRMLSMTRYDEAGRLNGKLAELRQLLYTARTVSPLFDTRRWVRDLEDACWVAWDRWVKGEGGDIWLKDEPVGVPHLCAPTESAVAAGPGTVPLTGGGGGGVATPTAGSRTFPSSVLSTPSLGPPESKRMRRRASTSTAGADVKTPVFGLGVRAGGQAGSGPDRAGAGAAMFMSPDAKLLDDLIPAARSHPVGRGGSGLGGESRKRGDGHGDDGGGSLGPAHAVVDGVPGLDAGSDVLAVDGLDVLVDAAGSGGDGGGGAEVDGGGAFAAVQVDKMPSP